MGSEMCIRDRPRVFAVDHVRAVADRELPEGLHVLEGGVGQRVERRVSETQSEVGSRLVQRDREGVVVDLLEAGHVALRAEHVVIGVRGVTGVVDEALDVLEEVARELSVLSLSAVVPRLDEVVGGDFFTVGEGQAFLDLDGEVLRVLRGDLLSDVVDGLAVGVVVDQTGDCLLYTSPSPRDS